MKPETFVRVRHEMNPPSSETDALDNLTRLNAFLKDVKPKARLRAKNEGGTTFLHTRTGSILGRFLKWLTVGWPEAMQQRDQAKKLINGVLSKIDCRSSAAKELKEKILDETLKVKKFSEFDIFTLRTQLESLQYLVQKDGGGPPESLPIPNPAKIQKSDFDEEDFHYGLGVATLNLTPTNYGRAEDLSITSDSDDDDDDDDDDENQRQMPVKETPQILVEPTDNVMPSSDISRLNHTSYRDAQPDPIIPLTKSPQLVDSDLTQALHEQSDATPSAPTPPNISATTLADTAISNQPAEAAIPAVDKKSSFGCFELTRQLSASSAHRIKVYQADAYIVPDIADDVEFLRGSTTYGSAKGQKEGLRIFPGVHTFYDEKRNFNKLLLASMRKAEDGLLTLLPPQEQKEHLQQLHNRYTSALTQAVENGAKTIALKPFRVPLLTDPEIATLAKAIKAFQQTHAEVKIHVVFAGDKEVTTFNTQSRLAQ